MAEDRAGVWVSESPEFCTPGLSHERQHFILKYPHMDSENAAQEDLSEINDNHRLVQRSTHKGDLPSVTPVSRIFILLIL